MPRTDQALSVTELTTAMKASLEPLFTKVEVRGEVVSLRANSSGHVYFTLTDETSQLPCVVWKSTLSRMPMRLQEGQKLVLSGSVQIYTPHGRYQLVVTRATDVGLGDLLARIELLKQQLFAEGLFAPERKRPLPLLPRRVGLITAQTGAAIHDFIVTARARHPTPIVFCPTLVQGDGAPATIAGALRAMGRAAEVDVIVLTRGGGSSMDLLPFSDERVVRAIATSPIPVVSAIGHEIDVTLADLAADRRAMTPTAAAELVIPRGADLGRRLGAILEQARDRTERTLGESEQRFDRALDRLDNAASVLLSRGIRRLERATLPLERAAEKALETASRRLERAVARLDAVHPRRLMEDRTHRLEEALARLDRAHPRHRMGPLAERLDQARKRLVAGHLERQLAHLQARLDTALAAVQQALTSTLWENAHRLELQRSRLSGLDLRPRLTDRQRQLVNLDRRSRQAISILIETRQHQLTLAAERLRLLSPLAPLDRGWAIVRRDSGAVIRSVGDIAPSDLVTIRLRDGTVRARIETDGPDATSPSPQAPEDSPLSQAPKEQR